MSDRAVGWDIMILRCTERSRIDKAHYLLCCFICYTVLLEDGNVDDYTIK